MNTISDTVLQDLMSSQSVGIFTDMVANPVFAAIEFEILSLFTEKNVPVQMITCDGLLPWCLQNPNHVQRMCLVCKSVRDRGHSLATAGDLGFQTPLKMPVGRRDELNTVASAFLNTCRTIQDLTEIEYNGISIGPGIVSTLGYNLKTADFGIQDNHDLILRLIQASLVIVESLPKVLTEEKIETLLVGNGRLATNWAASRCAESLGIRTYSYEYLPGTDTYVVAPVSPVHDISYIREKAQEFSRILIDDNGLEVVAEQFFTNSRQLSIIGKPLKVQNPDNAVEIPNKTLLPKNFNSDQRNIAIYLSSEWEFIALPGWENKLGENQFQIVSEICNHSNLDSSIVFWIRCHPSQIKNVSNETERIQSLSSGSVHILEPSSPVDSYALMEASEKTLTFGSTMGIEATYWGKPSILCGRSDYENLDVCFLPQNLDEIIQLINGDLEPKPKENSLSYGLYRQEVGTHFKNVSFKYPKFPKLHGKRVMKLYILVMTELWVLIRTWLEKRNR